MPRLVIAPAAQHDLQTIRDYIAKDDRGAARRIVLRLRDMVRMLAGALAIGHARPEISADIRSFVVNRYVLFYGPLDGAGGIELVRVLHGARDIEAVFSGDED
jgi:toxin ParE1/3/4